MLPTVVIVGRPNVGKSTLFNRLTRSRDALVADIPGLTRDRRYGRALVGDTAYSLVDTGGLFGDEDIAAALEAQVEQALAEADLALLVVDARSGMTAIDHEIAARLRRRALNTLLVINKIDGVDDQVANAEFAELGVPEVVMVSATHGRGIQSLGEWLQLQFAEIIEDFAPDGAADVQANDAIHIALVGRPNVGKSTLTNRLLGEQRQLVFNAPGTTRDAIDIPFEREGRNYLLIDTAGVRRKGRSEGIVEKFSIVKTLQALERAHLALVIMDAGEGVVDQDLHVLSAALHAGCGLIVVMNKWDGLTEDARNSVKTSLDRRLEFAPWVPVKHCSALHGTGVGHLWKEVVRVFRAGSIEVSTSVLTRLLTQLVATHPPPAVRGRVIKLRYAHKVGIHPPHIVIHGNQTESVPANYLRYLENGFREALHLVGTPVRIDLRTGDNPYADKRNELSARQQRRRQRVVRHRKKSAK